MELQAFFFECVSLLASKFVFKSGPRGSKGGYLLYKTATSNFEFEIVLKIESLVPSIILYTYTFSDKKDSKFFPQSGIQQERAHMDLFPFRNKKFNQETK